MQWARGNGQAVEAASPHRIQLLSAKRFQRTDAVVRRFGPASRICSGHPAIISLKFSMKRAASASYFLKVLLAARPGVGRIEDLRRHSLAFFGHLEAEDRILAVLHLEQVSR